MDTLTYMKSAYNQWGKDYDRMISTHDPLCIETLAALAGDKPVLELGVGTGRIAIPLAHTGVRVSGIDISSEMLNQLRAKDEAGRVSLIEGDFAELAMNERFGLIYIVCDTFTYLLTQQDQLRCICNVAKRLIHDGAFVIELSIPGIWIFHNGWTSTALSVSDSNRIGERFASTDLAAQLSQVLHVETGEEGVNIHPVQERYIWPSELDLMAQIAGLRLQDRWMNWKRDPITSTSTWHVSVYRPIGTS